jgi:amidophosphoribosyltransferase
MCGIVAMVGTSDVSVSLYDALTMLQHRGQDAAGIATSHNWCAMCFKTSTCNI